MVQHYYQFRGKQHLTESGLQNFKTASKAIEKTTDVEQRQRADCKDAQADQIYGSVVCIRQINEINVEYNIASFSFKWFIISLPNVCPQTNLINAGGKT